MIWLSNPTKKNYMTTFSLACQDVSDNITWYLIQRNSASKTGSSILWFYLMERGIEANRDKYNTIIKIKTHTTMKKIMHLNEIHTNHCRFISINTIRVDPIVWDNLHIIKKYLIFTYDTIQTLGRRNFIPLPCYVYAILIKEVGSVQSLLYSISKELVGP